MEIHAPDKPILTIKEAVVHLSIVTAGILIALSLEGLVEWRHHRSLVAEARANLTSEITANRKRADELLRELPEMRQRLQHGLDVLKTVTARDADAAAALFRLDKGGIVYSYDLAELRVASRTTAEVTGAFGLMDYGEVREYAGVYDRQNLFDRTQEEAWKSALSAFSLGQSFDFATATREDIENIRRQLRLAIGNLLLEEQVAAALIKAYDRALKEAH